jgi:hypothetical protein
VQSSLILWKNQEILHAMQQFLQLMIVAFLIVISIELLFIHRELARRPARGSQYNEDPPGQTINVNVGTPAVAAGSQVSVVPDRTDQQKIEASVLPLSDGMGQAKDSGEAARDLPPDEPVQSRPVAGAAYRATSSGLLAKKCPSCGMENSSMRSECFNCGISL